MTTTLFPNGTAPAENSLTTEERNALVMSCERLCKSLARKAAAGVAGVDVEDLEQDALLACVEAAKRWHPDRGTKFSTYATPAIATHLANIVTRSRCEGNIHLESWEAVEGREPADDAEELRALNLTPEQTEALARLGNPAALAVVLVLRGVAPDRIAQRLDLPVKDVKLALRNAARQLRRDLAWLSRPDLFRVTDEE